MFKVKICGIQDSMIAETAYRSGADYLGFVFAPSRRRIDPVTAQSIIRNLPEDIHKVGVFVESPVEEIIDIAHYCGLDHLQLHGNHWHEGCQDFRLPVIQSVSIKDNTDLGSLERPDADYLIFDTFHASLKGGTGKAFNWNILEKYTYKLPYFLAGGLTPLNVKEAIRQCRPYAVDVSSGVETDGLKDIDKIRQFLKNVKEMNHEIYHAG